MKKGIVTMMERYKISLKETLMKLAKSEIQLT